MSLYGFGVDYFCRWIIGGVGGFRRGARRSGTVARDALVQILLVGLKAELAHEGSFPALRRDGRGALATGFADTGAGQFRDRRHGVGRNAPADVVVDVV